MADVDRPDGLNLSHTVELLEASETRERARALVAASGSNCEDRRYEAMNGRNRVEYRKIREIVTTSSLDEREPARITASPGSPTNAGLPLADSSPARLASLLLMAGALKKFRTPAQICARTSRGDRPHHQASCSTELARSRMSLQFNTRFVDRPSRICVRSPRRSRRPLRRMDSRCHNRSFHALLEARAVVLIQGSKMSVGHSLFRTRRSWSVLVGIFLVVVSAASPVRAWGRLGHRVIARLAEKGLTPAAQSGDRRPVGAR